MRPKFALPFTVALSTLLAIGCQDRNGDTADEVADSLAAADTAPAATTLYERLGGEPAIAAVVDTFVALAAADTALNFTRQGTANEWEATPESIDLLKTRLVQFVGQATGGPQAYEGGDMATVHTGMEITNEEFDMLAGHLGAALDAYNVPEAEKQELFTIVETTRTAIVEPSPAATP
ncbi:MAG TPA: group 1 truncated hemoglobin [Gemmatimonadota bacterium]|nr:group 1 truncated hemoglobin [Gemmatimonadota bacterium]